MAVVTASMVSSGEVWKTPKPRAGISSPLFSVMRVCSVVLIVGCLSWSAERCGRSGADEHLEGGAVVHRLVAVGHLGQRDGAVEYAARVHGAVEDLRHEP